MPGKFIFIIPLQFVYYVFLDIYTTLGISIKMFYK